MRGFAYSLRKIAATEAERDRDEARPEGDRKGSGDEREDAEVGLEEKRRPLRAGDVVEEVDLRKN